MMKTKMQNVDQCRKLRKLHGDCLRSRRIPRDKEENPQALFNLDAQDESKSMFVCANTLKNLFDYGQQKFANLKMGHEVC